MKIGVSTSVLADGAKLQFDRLLAYEPDIVEFYTYPANALPLIERFCARHEITPALHVPTPHPGRMRRFCPTGPDPEEAAAALRALRTTAACAADLGALHVVVHFPTPYTPHSQQALDDFGPAFLETAADLAQRYGVPVLIENLTPNTFCATAAQYAEALAPWPDLGLCLDVGHAFLLAGAPSVLEFAQVLTERVRSVHLYDPAPDPPRHRPYSAPGEAVQPTLRHMDVKRIIRLCRPAAVVLEHHPTPDDGPQTLNWLRGLVSEGSGPLAAEPGKGDRSCAGSTTTPP